jgi:hypothetical protein
MARPFSDRTRRSRRSILEGMAFHFILTVVLASSSNIGFLEYYTSDRGRSGKNQGRTLMTRTYVMYYCTAPHFLMQTYSLTIGMG